MGGRSASRNNEGFFLVFLQNAKLYIQMAPPMRMIMELVVDRRQRVDTNLLTSTIPLLLVEVLGFFGHLNVVLSYAFFNQSSNIPKPKKWKKVLITKKRHNARGPRAQRTMMCCRLMRYFSWCGFGSWCQKSSLWNPQKNKNK